MTFSTFPEFTVLNLKHKDTYNKLTANYPPISDLSFSTLMIWWAHSGSMLVAVHNNNLVLNYTLPNDYEASGLCVTGLHDVNASCITILNYLKQNNKPARLVHVPEFVVNQLDSKRFKIREDVNYNEYLLDTNGLAKLDSSIHAKTRRKINKFLRECTQRPQTKELDLKNSTTRKHLLNNDIEWRKIYGTPNDNEGVELTALRTALTHSDDLGFRAIATYVGKELQGFVIFQVGKDRKHIVINHIRNQKKYDRTFDYLTHEIAKWCSKNNIPIMNIEMDLGIDGLRIHKLGLKPISAFKKFIIELA